MTFIALETVKSYQTQQESRNELSLTSSLFDAEPVGTSVTFQAQHGAQYMNDNIQVSQLGIFLFLFVKLHAELMKQMTGINS